jgi:4-aminobutyrate aminotransferase
MLNTPRILTPLPGPESKRIIKRDTSVSSPSLIKEYPLVIKRAEGMFIEDLDGNTFLDFMAGIAVTSTGHCHPEILNAIQKQSQDLLHICGTDFYYPVYTDLCKKLQSLAPGNKGWKVFLSNSGAEAVDGAIKLARFHTKREHILAFEGAFHGRTYGALSLTDSKPVQKNGFGPFLPGVYHVPFGLQADEIVALIKKSGLELESFAAIFVEPILGEGGYIIPPDEFLPQLREVCNEYGVLLVADEIQSGVGRTGKFLAVEHWGVIPDIITLAKGLGSGMPIGAILGTDEVMSWPPGSDGSTFGGNPVSCAASLATLALVENELMDNARKMGPYLLRRLSKLETKYKCVKNIRGKGLMIAMDVYQDDQPSHDAAYQFEQKCFQEGLLVLGCGEYSVRLTPPLIVQKSQIDIAVDIMETVLDGLSDE